MALAARQIREIQDIYDNFIFEMINLKKSILFFYTGKGPAIDDFGPADKIKVELQKIINHKMSNSDINDLDAELVPLAEKISVVKVDSDSKEDDNRFEISSDNPYVKVLLTANDRVIRNINYNRRTVVDTAVVNLASLLENTMKQLAQFTMLNFPEKYQLNSDSKLSLLTVLTSDSVDDLKEEVLQRYFSDLTYGSVEEWLPTMLKSVSGGKIKSDDMGSFKELFERRNIIVHNKSIVNTKYIEKVADTNLTKGDLIISDSKYIDNLVVVVINLIVELLAGSISNWNLDDKSKHSLLSYLNDAALPFYDERQFNFGVAYYNKMRDVSRKILGKKSPTVFAISYNYYLGLKFLDQLNTPESQQEVAKFFLFFKQTNWWDSAPKEVTVLPEVSLSKDLSEFASVLVSYADEVKEDDDASLARVLSWPMTSLLRDNEVWNDYLSDFYKQVW